MFSGFSYVSFLICLFRLPFSLLLSDRTPPILDCPTSTIVANNDEGRNVSTVSWRFSFTDNSLTAKETESFPVILTIEGKNVGTTLPKLMGIGLSNVKYSVTDAAGMTTNCSFYVEVKGKFKLGWQKRRQSGYYKLKT